MTAVETAELPDKHRFHPLASQVRRWLDRLSHGRLVLRLPSGETLQATGAAPGPEALMILHDWRALRRVVLQGAIGFAEGYLAGDWSAPDLVALMRLGTLNSPALGGLVAGGARHRLLNRLRHWWNSNSRSGSRRNIVSHYDLGNEFFALWLDPTMFYSSALWSEATATLEQAQAEKLARIIALLDLRGGERVLEIGCGWGALAVGLAQSGASEVTGLTLSPSQLDFARQRCAREAPGAAIDLRRQDYRDAQGSYDRVVSIEMIEAVGEAWWPAYFAKIAEVLRPGGAALIQAITIDETRFEDYRAEPDFIQRFIFPGGFLPTKSIIAEQAARAGLRIVKVENFALSYARTLAEWRTRFEARWLEVAALGFDERFRRMWTFYLCYCEAGFLEDATDVGFYLLEKQGAEQ